MGTTIVHMLVEGSKESVSYEVRLEVRLVSSVSQCSTLSLSAVMNLTSLVLMARGSWSLLRGALNLATSGVDFNGEEELDGRGWLVGKSPHFSIGVKLGANWTAVGRGCGGRRKPWLGLWLSYQSWWEWVLRPEGVVVVGSDFDHEKGLSLLCL